MNAFSEVILGLKSFSRAFRFISAHKLWAYVLLPGLVNFIFLLLAGVVAWQFSDDFVEFILSVLKGNETTAALISENADGIISFILTSLLRIMLVLILFGTYKYVVLVMMAPFLALLASRVFAILHPQKSDVSILNLLKEAIRGIAIAIRNLAVELFFVVVIFFFGFIPAVNILCPLFYFLIQFYFIGFSMMDYSSEQKQMDLSSSVSYIRQHRAFAVTNGGMFYFLFTLPFIGWLIAPGLSLIAASLGVYELDKQKLP